MMTFDEKRKLYNRNYEIFKALRTTMDNSKMKSAQTFVYAAQNGSVFGIKVHSLNSASKEKLLKIVNIDFCESLFLLQETPSTMILASYVADESVIKKYQHKELKVNDTRLVQALNDMPMDVLNMLSEKHNWRFDMNNGQITNVVVEG